MDLTLPQRVFRPVINFLVERFFPGGCFYGHDYMRAFSDLDLEDNSVTGRTAAMYLQSIIRKSDAIGVSIELHEVTENGRPIGSFVLRLDRMEGE